MWVDRSLEQFHQALSSATHMYQATVVSSVCESGGLLTIILGDLIHFVHTEDLLISFPQPLLRLDRQKLKSSKLPSPASAYTVVLLGELYARSFG